jgi:hypothetical protein
MRLSILKKKSSALSVWRQQIGCQLKIRRCRGPRPLAMVGFVVRRSTYTKLVDIRRISVCVLHDQFEEGTHPRIRFAVYRLGRLPWGVEVGGDSRVVLDKDLVQTPRLRAYGRRFEANGGWLSTALRMDRCLERHAKHLHAPKQSQLRLPRFWAALNTTAVRGDGPEFTTLCRDFGLPADVALMTCARRHQGRILYPLEFVSHEWRRFIGVYADLEHFFLRQVIRLENAGQLSGFTGACQYDLLAREFRH